MATFRCRSAFIAAVNVGTPDCKADCLLDFLRQLQCEKLYMVDACRRNLGELHQAA